MSSKKDSPITDILAITIFAVPMALLLVFPHYFILVAIGVAVILGVIHLISKAK